MNWLARLKELDSAERPAPANTQNPQKGGFDGFEGAQVVRIPAHQPAPRPEATARAEIERHLVELLDDAPHEIPEALAVALTDPDEALRCFRAIAAESRPTGIRSALDPDDRIRCRDCRNLRLTGVCLAATHLKAARTYSPDPALLRRCEAFTPMPDNPDQRTGADRWGIVDGRAASE